MIEDILFSGKMNKINISHNIPKVINLFNTLCFKSSFLFVCKIIYKRTNILLPRIVENESKAETQVQESTEKMKKS